MVVVVCPVEEKQNRHTFAREVVMVRPKVETLARPDVVDRRHPEFRMAFVDPVQRLAEIGVLFADVPIFQFMPPWTIVLLPLPMILVLILVLGFSYLLSIINVFVRDIQNIWIIISHSLLFISPIFWHLKDVEGVLLQIHSINPLGQIIEIAHSLVIYGEIPPISDWIYTTIFVFAIFFFGFAVFHRLENKITEEL